MMRRFTLVLLAALTLLGIGSASPTHAGLAAVGPIDPANGFPQWYEDSNGVRLGQCLDPQNPLCGPVADEMPDAGSAVDFPANFPGEFFWWSAEAGATGPGGERLLLVLAMEGAFGGLAEAVEEGNQISFGRLRIRLRDVTPGAEFTATHPYGKTVLVADERGRARITEDIGCEATPCDFSLALTSGIGPFLTCVDPAPPAGSVGLGLAECAVTGSPNGDNFFRVKGPGLDFETDSFTVTGMLFDPTKPPPPPPPPPPAPPPPVEDPEDPDEGDVVEDGDDVDDVDGDEVEEDEVEEDEVEEDEVEEDAEGDAGHGAQEIAQALAETFGGSEKDVLALNEQGVGFGAMFKLYAMAAAMGTSIEDLMATIPTDRDGGYKFAFGKMKKALTEEQQAAYESGSKGLGQLMKAWKSRSANGEGEATAAGTKPGAKASNGNGPPSHAKAHGRR